MSNSKTTRLWKNEQMEMIINKANKGGPADRWQRSSFAKVIFISKFSALSEFIDYLPTASDHIVSHQT